MKRYLFVWPLLLLAFSCTRGAQEKTVTYYYVLLNDAEVWETPSRAGNQLRGLSKGDTVSTQYAIDSQSEWQNFEYKNYRFFAYRPVTYALKSRVAKRKSSKVMAYKDISTYPRYEAPVRVSTEGRRTTTTTNTPNTGATIQTGPRGGRYYYNSNGNKTYIRRKN